MTTEDAVGLIAFENELDISKFLDTESVDRVRRLWQDSRASVPPATPKTRRISHPKTVNVTIAKDLSLKDPLLSPAALADAKLMAERVYPLLYILENSIRELILKVLEAADGTGWWNNAVPKNIRDKVEDRKAKEERRPWHGRRGAHAIFYTDFSDLGRIVISERNWRKFENTIPSRQWLTQRLEDLEPSRNIIAHCNPLHADDVDRLKVYLRDWQILMQALLGRVSGQAAETKN